MSSPTHSNDSSATSSKISVTVDNNKHGCQHQRQHQHQQKDDASLVDWKAKLNEMLDKEDLSPKKDSPETQNYQSQTEPQTDTFLNMFSGSQKPPCSLLNLFSNPHTFTKLVEDIEKQLSSVLPKSSVDRKVDNDSGENPPVLKDIPDFKKPLSDSLNELLKDLPVPEGSSNDACDLLNMLTGNKCLSKLVNLFSENSSLKELLSSCYEIVSNSQYASSLPIIAIIIIAIYYSMSGDINQHQHTVPDKEHQTVIHIHNPIFYGVTPDSLRQRQYSHSAPLHNQQHAPRHYPQQLPPQRQSQQPQYSRQTMHPSPQQQQDLLHHILSLQQNSSPVQQEQLHNSLQRQRQLNNFPLQSDSSLHSVYMQLLETEQNVNRLLASLESKFC